MTAWSRRRTSVASSVLGLRSVLSCTRTTVGSTSIPLARVLAARDSDRFSPLLVLPIRPQAGVDDPKQPCVLAKSRRSWASPEDHPHNNPRESSSRHGFCCHQQAGGKCRRFTIERGGRWMSAARRRSPCGTRGENTRFRGECDRDDVAPQTADHGTAFVLHAAVVEYLRTPDRGVVTGPSVKRVAHGGERTT